MSKNDFEKNVQQKMDELQLYPSAELWPEVERRIRKEKKRRWFIFWLLIPSILVGTGIAIYLSTKTTTKNTSTSQLQQPYGPSSQRDTIQHKNKIDSSSNTITSLSATDDKVSVEHTILKETINGSNPPGNTNPGAIQTVNERPRISVQKGEGNKTRSGKPNKEKQVDPVIKEEIEAPVTTNTDIKQPLVTKLNEQPPQKEVPVQVKSDTMTQAISREKESKPDTDTILAKKTVEIAINADSSKLENQPASIAKKKDKKWELGTTVSFGLSNRASGLTLGPQKRAYYSPVTSGGVASLADARGRSFFDSRQGLFWEAGIYAQKRSENRTTLSAGLTISSFSTRQHVGDFVDSLISTDANGYYRYGNRSVYKSRYYYLQVPLLFHWQLNKGKKFQLIWKNGLSLSVLLSSKALIYNGTVQGFYRDKTSMNKIQIAFRSGLYGSFGRNSAHPFSAGLFMNYNLSGLQGMNQFERNHLMSFGFQVLMPLKKN